MTAPKSNHPRLEEYILSEYRFQEGRAERTYARANWHIGVCALIGGAAYTARRTESIHLWTTNCIAFGYVLSGLLVILLLAGIISLVALAIIPSKYAVPGPSNVWLQYARGKTDPASASETVEGASSPGDADDKLLADLAKSADENRVENRRRDKWLNRASRLIALAAVLVVPHLLFAGLLHLTLGP